LIKIQVDLVTDITEDNLIVSGSNKFKEGTKCDIRTDTENSSAAESKVSVNETGVKTSTTDKAEPGVA
jgi:hypothetical protein